MAVGRAFLEGSFLGGSFLEVSFLEVSFLEGSFLGGFSGCRYERSLLSLFFFVACFEAYGAGLLSCLSEPSLSVTGKFFMMNFVKLF